MDMMPKYENVKHIGVFDISAFYNTIVGEMICNH